MVYAPLVFVKRSSFGHFEFGNKEAVWFCPIAGTLLNTYLHLRRQRTPSAITSTLKLKVMQVGRGASCGEQLMSNAVSSYGSPEI